MEKKVKFHHRCMSYCERSWQTHAHKKQSCPYDNIVKWNSIYTKKENWRRRRAKKINNFYVRQKHACLKARWMCQKKCECLPETHTPLPLGFFFRRGKIFFSLFSIIIYFYALSRKQSKKIFSSLMKFRWCWALRSWRKKFVYEMTVHRAQPESEQIYVN
jgi:hypothetical protein